MRRLFQITLSQMEPLLINLIKSELIRRTGYIYITASDYKTNGDVYAFDASGKKLFQFEVGLNPVKAVFVKR